MCGVLGGLAGAFLYNSKMKVRHIRVLLRQGEEESATGRDSSNRDLEEIRKNIIALIHQNNDLKLKNEIANGQIEKHYSLMHDSFIRMLIMGNAESTAIEETIKFYGVNSSFDRYRVMLVQIYDWDECHENAAALKSTLMVAINSILDYSFEICIIDDYTIGVLFMYQLSDKAAAGDKIHNCMDHLISVIKESQGITISVALGRSIHTLYDCLISYHSARMILMYHTRKGTYDFKNTTPLSEEDNEKMMKLLHALEVGELDECLSQFDDMFQPPDEEHNYTTAQRTNIVVLFRLFDDTIKSHSQLKKIFGDNQDYQEKFGQSTTLDDILKEFREMLEQACRCMENFSENKKKMLVNRAVQFIYENYTNAELSQTEIADRLQVSSSVLSIQFKEITGMNMSVYIRMLRIERVKKYLMETNWNLTI